MNILLVSSYGSALPMAYRLQQEGHEVYFWIKEGKLDNAGEGIVNRIYEENWKDYVDGMDLILFDHTDHGKDCEDLRKRGYPVIGGTVYTDLLERDRDFGQSEFKEAGFGILPSQKFDNFDDALNFIKENPTRYAVKLDGKAGDKKELTYVGKEEDASDVIAILSDYKNKLSGQIDSFILQEVADGVEIGVAGYFNGTKFVNPIEINFEHKKLATGNLGPNTGEMGTGCLFVTTDHPLFKQTIDKMTPFLQGYHGCFDINFIATEHDIYPLEPTCRFGYPINALQAECIKSNLGERLLSIANGGEPNSQVDYEFGVVLMGVVPPFPYQVPEISEEISKDNLIITKSDREGIYPVEIYEKDGDWFHSGGDGEPFLVVGMGSTMQEAKLLAYSRMVNITTPNLFYRTDISDRWEWDYPRLKEWGYL